MQPKIEIIGDVNTCIPWIPWAKKQWDLRDGRWLKKVDTITIEFFRTNSVGFIRFFTQELLPTFATHPRSSHYTDGINYKQINEQTKRYAELDNNNSVFPLIDNDFGTLTITVDENKNIDSVIPESDNYGINHWVNEDTIAGWRGWPAVAIGCSRSVNIPGLTEIDVATAYDTYYTPLSGKLYFEGISNPTPGKVRGAAVSAFGLVIITTVNYTQYDIAGAGDNMVNPDGIDWLYDNNATEIPEELKPGKVGGYYDELYVLATEGLFYSVNGRKRSPLTGVTNQTGQSVSGWLRIGHIVSQIPNLPVWLDPTGLSGRGNDIELSWSYAADPSNETAGIFTSYITPITESGSHTKTIIPGIGTTGYRRNCETTWVVGRMLTKNGNFYINSTDYSTLSDIPDESTFEDVVVKMELRPTPTDQYIGKVLNIDIDSGIFRFVLTFYNYKSGPFTWTTSQGSFVGDVTGSNITLDAWDTCGMITITVTDLCGVTASINVRGRTGAYVNILYTPMLECLGGLDPCGSSITPYQYCNFNEMQAIAWANGDATYTWSCYFAPPDPAWLMWCHSGTAPDVPAGTELCRVTGEWQC